MRRVAPWEITRVPNEDGLIFFDAPVAGITPAGLMAFTSAEGVSWYRADAADRLVEPVGDRAVGVVVERVHRHRTEPALLRVRVPPLPDHSTFVTLLEYFEISIFI